MRASADHRTMEGVWTCQFCTAVFHRLDHHKRHTATHSAEKPFKCGFCGSQYKRGDVLRRHWKSCSVRIRTGQAIPWPRIGGKERHACDVCAKLKKSCDGGQPCIECSTRRRPCTYLRLQSSGGLPLRQATDSSVLTPGQIYPESAHPMPIPELSTWSLGPQNFYPDQVARLRAQILRNRA
ncbi:hypothetical protein BO94DRAFT_459796 [Aspergillus sclerotioniger CBS 115572]|uniref:Zn(2)-C6 fungal-type domain-containing protein n=1 Tax=Aspergillus sclerotioniger CBS 115572 TaxID=1450535 RepID=A0A317X7G1_9EURO|nr:hypothetical protein BO94DRAFT_459796 [Aspergillus sclerotioniger CBS 115572]PWY93572.1 hypothetical protein BO94DRAFT_459796 [Aspergillus sclerotioniger CBS 115572]